MPRTWWHLEGQKRKPGDYDIAASKLLYYPERGFETDVPVADWYRRHQRGSPFGCSDWERFRDPRETTYTRYTTLQARREIYIDGLLQSIEDSGYDLRLSADWLRSLAQTVATLRYPVHGLQMASAYVGQMAPGGRVVIAALLQTADEIRRIQRLAYRLRQLQLAHPGVGDPGRALWETDPAWQPLREAIERLLVAWDWGEAFIALNFVVKPAFDELFMVHFGRLARDCGDEVLHKILAALNEDCAWHREWSEALVRTTLEDNPALRAVLEEWIGRWRPFTLRSLQGFARLFQPLRGARQAAPFAAVVQGVEATLDEHWRRAIGAPPPPGSGAVVAATA